MKALVTGNVNEQNRERLTSDLGLEIAYHPIADRTGRFSDDEMIELLEDVEILIVGFEGISLTVLNNTPDLEIIACTRGGPDANVDINAATERGIPVLYAPGRNAVSVADFTLGMLLAVTRHIAHSHHLLHTGTYTGTPLADTAGGAGEREDVTWGVDSESPYTNLKGPELEGKTLGIVGYGAIGQEVVQRARGFDVNFLSFDPYVDAADMADDVEKVDLETLCRRSDFVSVHVPVTDATRGLIGADEFELMKDEAYFINTARGAIIDQDALIDQLQSGGLRGAALDVYDQEPLPEDHPLLDLDSVVTTPHLAGAAEEVIDRHSEMLVDDIAAILNGRKPDRIANEETLEESEIPLEGGGQ